MSINIVTGTRRYPGLGRTSVADLVQRENAIRDMPRNSRLALLCAVLRLDHPAPRGVHERCPCSPHDYGPCDGTALRSCPRYSYLLERDEPTEQIGAVS